MQGFGELGDHRSNTDQDIFVMDTHFISQATIFYSTDDTMLYLLYLVHFYDHLYKFISSSLILSLAYDHCTIFDKSVEV